jgi:hypothetical protein
MEKLRAERGWIACWRLIWGTLSSAAWAQNERQDLCGYVFPVDSYRAEIDGMRIELTANDRLVINGSVVAEFGIDHESRPSRPWGDSANGARIARTRDYILVETLRTDCVDYDSARIFVIDRNGSLRATSLLWSLNDAWAGFSADDAGLVFSSARLCGQHSGAPAGRAYVHVLRDGEREFRREERVWDETCHAPPDRALPFGAIYFAPMQPISPSR